MSSWHKQDYVTIPPDAACNIGVWPCAGNYDTYVQTRKELEENQMKKYRWEQDQIANMKEYIARFGHGSAKLARQAQSKEKTLDKMVRDGLTEKVEGDRVVQLNFENVGKLPPPVLQFSEVTFGYSRDRVLYRDVSPDPHGPAKLCTYFSWFAMPDKVNTGPHHEMPLPVTKLDLTYASVQCVHSMPMCLSMCQIHPSSSQTCDPLGSQGICGSIADREEHGCSMLLAGED